MRGLLRKKLLSIRFSTRGALIRFTCWQGERLLHALLLLACKALLHTSLADIVRLASTLLLAGRFWLKLVDLLEQGLEPAWDSGAASLTACVCSLIAVP